MRKKVRDVERLSATKLVNPRLLILLFSFATTARYEFSAKWREKRGRGGGGRNRERGIFARGIREGKGEVGLHRHSAQVIAINVGMNSVRAIVYYAVPEPPFHSYFSILPPLAFAESTTSDFFYFATFFR